MPHVRHIALFRWKGDANVDVAACIQELRDIVAEVPGATALAAGEGLGLSGPTGFDFGLTADFDDVDAYQQYREHPRHQRLLQTVLVPAAETISAVQIEIS